jgi:hypothetical protein
MVELVKNVLVKVTEQLKLSGIFCFMRCVTPQMMASFNHVVKKIII